MRVEIQLVNELGRALFSAERKVKAPTHVGELRLREERSAEHGRSMLVATLQDSRGGLREPVIPALLDAQVLWIEAGSLRIRGTERIDGVECAQAWAVKVLSC